MLPRKEQPDEKKPSEATKPAEESKPTKPKSPTRKILETLKKYPKIEIAGKDLSYKLHKSILEEKDSPESYLLAAFIPSTALLGLLTKSLSDTCRVIDTAGQSIRDGEYAGGNIQTLAVDSAEYTRHILGIVAGIPLAIYSPKLAADTFLTIPADPSKTFLNPKEGARLYAMGDLLNKFFAKHDIDYRIASGTALGARREGGIIRNDDDIDLMIHPNFVEKLKTLIEDGTFTKETDISIEKQAVTGGWQCFYADSPKGNVGTPTEKIGKPFVDIFPGVWRKNAAGTVISYGEDKMYYQSKGDYFTKEEWSETPQQYRFGPTQMLGIKAIDAYIERSYGPMALKYVTLLYPHEVYSTLYSKPHKIFSVAAKHPTPRFMRHKGPSPLPFDEEEYRMQTAKWNENVSEFKSGPGR